MVSLKWCCRQKEGMKLIDPNDNLAQGYLKMAENALGTMNREKKYNLMFAISACYYSMYYSLYSVCMKKSICIICESVPEFYTQKNSYSFYRCTQCGLLMLYPLPSPTTLTAVYDYNYFKGAKKGFGYIDYEKDKQPMRTAFLRMLDIMQKYYEEEKGVLLDIGTGTGYFLRLAQQKGWHCTACPVC